MNGGGGVPNSEMKPLPLLLAMLVAVWALSVPGRAAAELQPSDVPRSTQIGTGPIPEGSKAAPALPAERIDPEYRRLRWQVFTGIFVGYAAFYLVRKNFALALPDILKEHPEYSKAALGSAMTGLSVAYGVSKFIMGSVSDRSNPRWFMTIGLLLTAGVTFAFGTIPAIYGSLTAVIALQTLNGWFNGMGWPCASASWWAYWTRSPSACWCACWWQSPCWWAWGWRPAR